MRPFVKSHSSTVLNVSVVLCVLVLHIFVMFWLQKSRLWRVSTSRENSINVSWIDNNESMGEGSVKLDAGGAGMKLPQGLFTTTEILKTKGTSVIGQETLSSSSAEPVFVKTGVVSQATMEPSLLPPIEEKNPVSQPNNQHKENRAKTSSTNPSSPKAALKYQKQADNKDIKAPDQTVQISNSIPSPRQQSENSNSALIADKEQALANVSGTKSPSTLEGNLLGAGNGKPSMTRSGKNADLNGAPSVGPKHLNSSEVRFKNRVSPIYPREAQLRGYQGEVVVFIIIDQLGRVKSKRIQKTSGHRILDEAALNAAQNSSYHPHIINGQAHEVQTTVNYQFKLGRK